VAKPGSYLFTEGMTVRDLIFKGGNVLESAYLDEAEISSKVTEEERRVSKAERHLQQPQKSQNLHTNNTTQKNNQRHTITPFYGHSC
jgi:hypothetical protein